MYMYVPKPELNGSRVTPVVIEEEPTAARSCSTVAYPCKFGTGITKILVTRLSVMLEAGTGRQTP